MFLYVIVVITIEILSSIVLIYFLDKNKQLNFNIILSMFAGSVIISIIFPVIWGGFIGFNASLGGLFSFKIGIFCALFITFVVYITLIFIISALISSLISSKREEAISKTIQESYIGKAIMGFPARVYQIFAGLLNHLMDIIRRSQVRTAVEGEKAWSHEKIGLIRTEDISNENANISHIHSETDPGQNNSEVEENSEEDLILPIMEENRENREDLDNKIIEGKNIFEKPVDSVKILDTMGVENVSSDDTHEIIITGDLTAAGNSGLDEGLTENSFEDCIPIQEEGSSDVYDQEDKEVVDSYNGVSEIPFVEVEEEQNADEVTIEDAENFSLHLGNIDEMGSSIKFINQEVDEDATGLNVSMEEASITSEEVLPESDFFVETGLEDAQGEYTDPSAKEDIDFQKEVHINAVENLEMLYNDIGDKAKQGEFVEIKAFEEELVSDDGISDIVFEEPSGAQEEIKAKMYADIEEIGNGSLVDLEQTAIPEDDEVLLTESVSTEENDTEEVNAEEFDIEEVNTEEFDIEEVNTEEIDIHEVNAEEFDIDEVNTEEFGTGEVNQQLEITEESTVEIGRKEDMMEEILVEDFIENVNKLDDEQTCEEIVLNEDGGIVRLGEENARDSEEELNIDACIDRAFSLKENGDLEGAILYYMYALDKEPDNNLVFWIVLDICTLYKTLGQAELAKGILESYVSNFGDVMDMNIRQEIEKNLV